MSPHCEPFNYRYGTMHRKVKVFARAFTKGLDVSVHGNVTKLMRCFYLVNKADYTVILCGFIFNWYFLITTQIVLVSFMNIIDTSVSFFHTMHFSCKVPYKLRNH